MSSKGSFALNSILKVVDETAGEPSVRRRQRPRKSQPPRTISWYKVLQDKMIDTDDIKVSRQMLAKARANDKSTEERSHPYTIYEACLSKLEMKTNEREWRRLWNIKQSNNSEVTTIDDDSAEIIYKARAQPKILINVERISYLSKSQSGRDESDDEMLDEMIDEMPKLSRKCL